MEVMALNLHKEVDSLIEIGFGAKELAVAMFEMLMKQKSPFVDVPIVAPSKKQTTGSSSKKEKYNDKNMTTVRISIGKKEKVSVGNILSAVAGETGLPGSIFGAIRIENKYTELDVPKQYRDLVIEKLNKAKIKGHRVVVS